MKLFISVVLSLMLFSVAGALSTAQAVISIPSFPVCSNPTGSLLAQYNSGVHGIVGNTNQFSGSDSVFSLSDGNALQCFCGDNGAGIQTNWLKIGSVSEQ